MNRIFIGDKIDLLTWRKDSRAYQGFTKTIKMSAVGGLTFLIVMTNFKINVKRKFR